MTYNIGKETSIQTVKTKREGHPELMNDSILKRTKYYLYLYIPWNYKENSGAGTPCSSCMYFDIRLFLGIENGGYVLIEWVDIAEERERETEREKGQQQRTEKKKKCQIYWIEPSRTYRVIIDKSIAH